MSDLIAHGIDGYGAEYKRTPNDFHFRRLEQDNCVCSICHGTGAKIEFEYVTRNYESARRKGKICENLQAHGHSFWICPACIKNLVIKSNGLVNVLVNERIKQNDDLISRQAAIDALHMHLMYRMGTDSNKKRLDEWINNLPSVQPERQWIPCSNPPKHHRDVIVRGTEVIGNVTVHKVMQWDVDTWRPTDYAPSIIWMEWSEI